MEYFGAIAGVAIAVALGAWLRSKYPAASPFSRFMQWGAILVVAAAAAAVGSVGGNYVRQVAGGPATEDIDRAVQQTKAFPLVGLVVSENPSLDAKLRAAVEYDLRHPNAAGPKATVKVGTEIRQHYIAPALRNADDAPALAAVASLQKLLTYLQVVNPALCHEYGLRGLDASRLDAQGLALLREGLATQEAAYRNGKTATPKPPIRDEDVTSLLASSGYTPSDLEQLSKSDKASAQQGCAIVLKLYSAPARLPPEQGGRLARWLLTVSP
jgi:hypothetical protein